VTKRLLSVPIISIPFVSEATQFSLACSIQTLYFPLAFERGAEETAEPTGGDHGWADVWMKDHFAWEYNGSRANLDAVLPLRPILVRTCAVRSEPATQQS
jgi:hypothetical protein